MKKLIRGHGGFSLIETLVALAITSIIIVGMAGSITQLVKISPTNSSKLDTTRNTDTAGFWLVKDFEPANAIPTSVSLTPGTNTLTITQSVHSPNDTTVTYRIDANKNLIRTVGSASSIVGANITRVDYTIGLPSTVQIISASGQSSLSLPYQLASRLNSTVPLMVANGSLPGGDINLSYGQQLVGLGGVEPYSWSILSGSLPSGLSLNSSTGFITGTPTSANTFNFTAKITDSAAATATKALSIVISAAPSISTASLPGGEVSLNYSQTVAASGGSVPYTWTVDSGSLPAGLSLDDASGIISGSPSASGLSNFTVKVADGVGGSATKALSINILAAPTITTSSLPNGSKSAAYNQTLGVSGGTSPYSWSVISGALPGGLSLNGSSGAITGTPTADGTFNFTVQVADSLSITASKALAIAVSTPAVSITTSSLPNGKVGTAYSQTLGAAGGVPSYTWSTTGSLPNGLTLNASTGNISGTPTVSGTFSFTVQVTDSVNSTASQNLSIKISGTSDKPPTAYVSGGGFTSPGNVYVQDNAYATTTGAATQQYKTFGFVMPAGATIDGIQVTMVGFCSGKDAYLAPSMSWNAGTTFSSPQTSATFNSSSNVTLSLGGANDTWGRTWASSDFSNANFLLSLAASGSMNSGHALKVDYVHIVVYYTPP